MESVPRHLTKIFQTDLKRSDSHNLEGTLKCRCGGARFLLKIFSDVDRSGCLHVKKYKDDYALSVNALCDHCGVEWEVFDMSKHGYNGFVCHDGLSVSESERKNYKCPKCEGESFEVSVGIEIEDKKQFIEEVVEEDPDIFTEDDYVDAFDWIVISVRCGKCGYKMDQWVDFETA